MVCPDIIWSLYQHIIDDDNDNGDNADDKVDDDNSNDLSVYGAATTALRDVYGDHKQVLSSIPKEEET